MSPDTHPSAGSFGLRLAVVAGLPAVPAPLAAHLRALSDHLGAAGHEVVDIGMRADPGGLRGHDGLLAPLPAGARGMVPLLALTRITRVLQRGTGGTPRLLLFAEGLTDLATRATRRPLLAALCRRLGSARVHLGGPWPTGGPDAAGRGGDTGAERAPARLLAFGSAAGPASDGLDALVGALADVPGLTLTIADDAGDAAVDPRLVALVRSDPRLAGRVRLARGIGAPDALADLLSRHDVLAVPPGRAGYQHDVVLGLAHGLPVLAPDGGRLRDGVDGLLVPAGDGAALVAALRRLGDPSFLAGLRRNVGATDIDAAWAGHLGLVESLVGRPGPTREGRVTEAARGRRGAWPSPDPLPDLSGLADLPAWAAAPVDVLAESAVSDEARAWARRAGLPRRDGAAAWAAAGACAALAHVDEAARGHVVDLSGPASPFRRAARACGVDARPATPAVVAARLAAGPADGGDDHLAPGTIGVLARLHPRGCTAADVDATLSAAARLLRPGGIVVVTIPLGADAAGGIDAAGLFALEARAHGVGLRVVGGLATDLVARVRRIVTGASDPEGLSGLVRLTLRRR